MNIAPHYRRSALLVAALVFIADQSVKYAMIAPLQLPSRTLIHIISFFDFRWQPNYGVSLGFLEAQSEAQRWMLVALTGAIALAVGIWMWRERTRGDALALAMVLGGALGNICDRVRYGYVVDYADLHFSQFRPFQIFNLGDAAITIGVLILLARAFAMRNKD